MKILYSLLILLFLCNTSYAKRLDEMNANTNPDITNDFIYSQDVSDTSENSHGTGKSLTIKNLLKAGKITVDGTNVGINSINPTQQVDVVGTVKATAFIGDGSGLTGVSGSGASVSDTVYGVGWDGDTTTAPSKNAVYDKIQTIGSGSGGSANAAYTVCASDVSSNETCDYTCDGTNDQSEIQTAINLATALPYGGKVLLTEGHFNISGSIVPKSNVWLQGSGWQTVLLGTTALANTAVIEDSTTYSPSNPLVNFQVTDLKIDGSGMNRTGYNVGRKAIFITYLSKVVFRNLYLYNTPATCLGADFFYDGIIEGNIVDTCGTAGQAYNVGSNGIGVGTRGSTGYEDEPLIITNNIAKNVANKGIMVEAQDSATSPRHTIISNNLAYDNKDGFSIAGSLHITFTGNESWGNSQDGVWVEAQKRNGSTLTWTNIIIANNNVHDNSGDGFEIKDESSTDFIFTGNISKSNSGVGLKIKPTRSIVSNNIITTNGLEGIYMNIGSAGKNMRITNNIISNNGTLGTVGSNDGVHIKTTTVAWDGLQINNNSILDSQGTPTQRYGIYFDNATGGTLTNVQILENYFSGNTAGTILNSAFASTNFTSMITTGGNFGIGTFTAPTAKLDVYGTVNATAFTGDGSGLTGISGGSIGIGTANTITFWPTTTTIGSLPTATYPSLTELSYVKGATSNIQTQIDGLSVGSGGWTDGGTNVYLTTTADNVGIGTTAAIAQLFVSNVGTQASFRVDDSLGDTTPFLIDSSGNIGIGTTTASKLITAGSTGQFTVDSNGTIVWASNTANTFTSTSSGNTPIAITANSLTSGNGFSVSSSSAGQTVPLISFTQSGASSGGTLRVNQSSATSTGAAVKVTNAGTGTALLVEDVATDATPLIVLSDGNTGIGTTVPTAKLSIFGTGTGATPTQIWKDSSGTQRMVVMDNGTVGIGTAAPGSALDVNGTATVTGFKMTTSPTNGYVMTSDANGTGTWQVASGGSVGIGTANTITFWPTTTTIGSLPTATYPSLTELSYVKGATSNIQTQINGLSTGSGGWTDGGTNVYTTTTTDQVAIGTTTPVSGSILTVNGTVAGGGTGPIAFTNANVGIGTTTAGSLVTIGSTGQVTISSAGAIATSSTVSVADDAYAAGWDGSTAVPTKNAVYDKIESMGSGAWTDAGAFVYATTSTDNFGIGTTAPNQRFQIKESSTANVSFEANNTNAAGLASFRAQNDTGKRAQLVCTGGSYGVPNVCGMLVTTGDAFSIAEEDGTQNVTVSGTGNVGIGSTAPDSILNIPSLKSTTGTRYLCIGTTGRITSSASACSGT